MTADYNNTSWRHWKRLLRIGFLLFAGLAIVSGMMAPSQAQATEYANVKIVNNYTECNHDEIDVCIQKGTKTSDGKTMDEQYGQRLALHLNVNKIVIAHDLKTFGIGEKTIEPENGVKLSYYYDMVMDGHDVSSHYIKDTVLITAKSGSFDTEYLKRGFAYDEWLKTNTRSDIADVENGHVHEWYRWRPYTDDEISFVNALKTLDSNQDPLTAIKNSNATDSLSKINLKADHWSNEEMWKTSSVILIPIAIAIVAIADFRFLIHRQYTQFIMYTVISALVIALMAGAPVLFDPVSSSVPEGAAGGPIN